MNYEEIKKIIFTMKSDYEDRIDNYIINIAELSREKKILSKDLKIIIN